MLKFHGHTFADSRHCSCCVKDAGVVVIDPTNTGSIRRGFRSAMQMRWNQMRLLTRGMIMDQDILGLKASSMLQVAAPGVALSGTRQEMFQRWFDMALSKVVLGGDGSWMQPYITKGFAKGVSFAQSQLNAQVTNQQSQHREDALIALAKSELQGIVNAVSQQAVRAVALGLSTSQTPMTIVRAVWKIIDKTGSPRAQAMIELLVVSAHAHASLDVYEANGINKVGLIAESATKARQNAQGKSKATKDAKASRGTGPGSQSYYTPPSPSTIGRIRQSELRTNKRLGENVNVLTAGDDAVCIICEDIADDGPYSINEARSLIPAHPNCRCVFIPADDDRFSQLDL